MTKQRWEQVRQLDELPIDVYWEYYQEKGGIVKDYTIFKRLLEQAMFQRVRVLTKKGIRSITHHSALQSVYKYFNNKFNEVTTQSGGAN